MPVKCELRNGKYRIIGPDGKIEMNKSGTPVDGGGHDSQNACNAQARAINSNSLAVAYIVASVDLEQESALRYKKELIYVGDFEKPGEFSFTVDEKSLVHWKNTFDQMKEVGVEIPVAIEHTTDPEKRRGTVVEMELGTNSRGLPAIFGIIEFGNEEYAKLADTAQVSIYVPPESEDGKGNTYVQPIRAVALTDYPVIPKLDGFEAIAASLVSFRKEPKMALSEFAKSLNAKLGWEFENDADVETAVLKMAIRQELAEEAAGEEKKEEEKEEKKEEEMAENKEGEEKEEKKEMAISASMISMLKENREMKVSKLVQAGKITKAVSDKLKEKYCEDKVLELALSGNSNDGFDSMIETLSLNDSVVSMEDKTKGQVLKLSAEDNPLIKDAEARAEKANR